MARRNATIKEIDLTTVPSHTWRGTCSRYCLMEGVNGISARFRVPYETYRARRRACHLSYQQSWRQKNPAYGAAYARAYRAHHRHDPEWKRGKPHRTSGTMSAKRERSEGKKGCSRDAILALRPEPPTLIHEQFTITSPCRLTLRTLPETPNVMSLRTAITIISPRFVSHRYTTKINVRVVQCRYAELCKVEGDDRF